MPPGEIEPTPQRREHPAIPVDDGSKHTKKITKWIREIKSLSMIYTNRYLF